MSNMTLIKAMEIVEQILMDDNLAHIDNRMEAWHAAKRAGVDVPWFVFKRMRSSIIAKTKGGK